jgi:hypothetical protein
MAAKSLARESGRPIPKVLVRKACGCPLEVVQRVGERHLDDLLVANRAFLDLLEEDTFVGAIADVAQQPKTQRAKQA